MAPSPENDNTPKAPDKNSDKSAKCAQKDGKEKNNKEVTTLNENELKVLLEEAVAYKNPKDREGKSELFNDLLSEAEETERNARAAKAGGSELVRYCNPSAKRNSRHRRKPSSISENMMHGGSLDNLAKEDPFEMSKHRTRKSVSARQREGGSLPCNVNSSSAVIHSEYQFLEEVRKKKEKREIAYDPIDCESDSLLEHDSLDRDYLERSGAAEVVQCSISQPTFTTKVNLHVTNVDDTISFAGLDSRADRKVSDDFAKSLSNKCVLIPSSGKKVDENGNAVQTRPKKKKIQTDKNVVVLNSENVEGHRGDIINDVNKLVEYIGGGDDQPGRNSRSNWNKKIHRHLNEDVKGNKKQRAHSSKGKEARAKLQKSNSLGEIFSTNMEEFEEDAIIGGNGTENKPRERRSWGNMEPLNMQNLYANASAENLESAEFRVVTKKKKTRKRRNSVRCQNVGDSTGKASVYDRNNSPDLRRKSASSVPHSEKSNDSSDVDSVHSLPIDTQRLNLATAYINAEILGMPVSYADMARNNERANQRKERFSSDSKVPIVNKEKSPIVVVNNNNIINNKTVESAPIVQNLIQSFDKIDKAVVNNVGGGAIVKNVSPPDVHNIKNFPAIQNKVQNYNQYQTQIINADRTNNAKNSGVHNIGTNNSFNHNKVHKTSNNTTRQHQHNLNRNVKNNNGIGNNNNIPPRSMICVMHNNVAHHPNNIQTDLSIIQANEKETIQYNIQMMPANIPDVQTIEKMHFIGQGHQQFGKYATMPPPHRHHHHHHYDAPIPPPPPPPVTNVTTTSTTTPPTVVALIANDKTFGSAANSTNPTAAVVANPTNGSNSNNNNNSSSYIGNANLATTTTTKKNNSATTTAMLNCDSSNDLNCNNDVDDRPPVVILSGSGGGKEVPGLVFGFDINEQLLSEDICDDFVARYVVPDVYSVTSHNHDKIVNYIGLAWEETMVNLSSGKVQYYSET